MKLNLEYYRTFFAAANFLSFTQAANHLFLTQSAVSQSVKKLEQELGCLLFDRSPQGLKLTTEGEILYRHVREAFEELQNGEWELKKLASFQDGELKIGATETSLYILLGPVMKQFKKKFPQIHVTFTGSTTSDTCRHLTDGAIEIAFLISPLPPNVHFQLTEIMEIQDVFIASSHFPIDFDKTYTPEEIACFPLISISNENSMRIWLNQWFLAHNVLFVPDYTVRGTGLVMPLLTNHLGIAVMPDYFVNSGRPNELRKVSVSEELPPRKLYLATNSQIPVSGICREFIRLATEYRF